MIEDNAQRVLYVYAHFKSEPGDVLNSNYFLGIARLRRWLAKDLDNGIARAREAGWVEEAERGWRLTNAGFAEASQYRVDAAAS